MAAEKKTKRIEVPEPRPHHYAFAFRFIPQIAFNDPHAALMLGLDMPAGIVKTYWNQCGENFAKAGQVSPDGLKSELVTFHKNVVALVTLPKPQVIGEAFYVAIACPSDWIEDNETFKGKKPTLRCFVLSKSDKALSKTDNAGTLREVTLSTNGALEYAVPIEKTAFLATIGEQISDKPKSAPPLQPKSPTGPASKNTAPEGNRYYVTLVGNLRGPFELSFIQAMVLAGHFPSQIPICPEGGQTWEKLPANSLASKRGSNDSELGGDTIALMIVGGLFVLIFLIVLLRDLNGTRSSFTSETNDGEATSTAAIQPTSSSDIAPSASPQPDSSSQTTSPLRPLPPASDTPAPDTTIVTDTDGRKYRVATIDYYKMVAEQGRLARESKNIDDEKRQLDALGSEIESERASLDNTDTAAVDSFNQKVNNYNTSKSNLQTEINTYNQDVDDSNSALSKTGTPVQ